MKKPKIDGERLWASMMYMGRIGATPGGGSGRIALTDLDREARDVFVDWCREAGCAVRIDRMGNIFARRAGTDEARPPVMTGSHLDTQPLGGKFDGVYGVLAGLEVVRTLNDASIETEAPIDVVVWTDEEGVRFQSSMIASGIFAGRYDLDHGLSSADSNGNTIGGELERIGYAGPEPVGGYPVDAFFEAHIEQGPLLEAEGKSVGVVLGAQGKRCYRVTVEGEEGHAGTLPMDQRRDALLGAARMIDAVNRVAFSHQPRPVITVGAIRARPNSPNTISGRTEFTIDSRHPDGDLLAAIGDDLRRVCAKIADEAGLGVNVEQSTHRPTVTFDPSCITAIREAAEGRGISHRDIYSAAGHDACNISLCAPTGMIFVPCEKGISHNEKENAKPEDLAAGCEVLLGAVLGRANRESRR
jgi:beta-ureidopropionase / N-carbamoyl-L-amino-acid hydrolase